MKNKIVYSLILILISLSGCVPPTPMEMFSIECEKNGLIVGSDEHSQCVKSAAKAYDAEIVKRYKEQEKQRVAAEKEKQRQIQAALVAQRKFDESKCSGYGYKRGTPDFAGCVMKLDKERDEAIEKDMEFRYRRAIDIMNLQNQERLIQQQNSMHCQSTYIGNTTQTNCF